MRTQGTKFMGVAGGMALRAMKMSGKFRYLRNAILNFLCSAHWINGRIAPSKKKNTRP